MAELEAAFLAAVNAGQLADSGDFAAAQNVEHQVLVGLLKSLLASDMITTEVSWPSRWTGSCDSLPHLATQARQLPIPERTLAPPTPQDIEHFRYTLTAEAHGYLGVGSPEAQVFNAVPPEGITLADVKVGRAGRRHMKARKGVGCWLGC